MRKLISIIYVASLVTAGLLATIISPLTVLLASISIIAFLTIARQMNLARILMMMKNYAKNVSRMRFEIRAKLHTGFCEYNESLDSKESSGRSCSCIR